MRLSLEPAYQSTPIMLSITIAVIVMLFLVTPTGLRKSRRIWLLGLRTIAVAALLLALLRPALIRTDNRPASATLAIALDTSRSMTLASGDEAIAANTAGESRWQQQQRVLEKLASELSSLDDNLRVAVVGYDAETKRIGEGLASELPTWANQVSQMTAKGNHTNLSSPVENALEIARATPLAGVTLLSDGTQNTPMNADPASNQSSSKDPRQSARLLGATGVPLWTIALGPPASAVRQPNLAVTGLPETYVLFSGNEAEVEFEVTANGLSNRSLTTSLTWINEDGESAVASTRTVRGQSDNENHLFKIPIIAPKPGQYRLVARAEPIEGESVLSDNELLAFVTVREGGGRVLYLEGTPRLEQTYLRRSLRRFPDLEITYRWIPRDTASRWPIDLADDLKPGRFDVVILGDLHSAALGNTQLTRLADAIGEGAALITLGGERAYGPGGYAGSPLKNVLPIQMDRRLAQEPGLKTPKMPSPPRNGVSQQPGQISKPLTFNPTNLHPITSVIAADNLDAIRQHWRSLTPMPGANAWPKLRVTPGVETLLTDQDSRPMMVTGEYGKGRVVSLAFDSTWLWWRHGQSETHRRFWRQLILWSLSREETLENTIAVSLPKRRMTTSEPLPFTASWSPPEGDAPPGTRLTATLLRSDGKTIELSGQATSSENDGTSALSLEGVVGIDSLAAGVHQIRVQADMANSEQTTKVPEPTSLYFQVVDDTRELTRGMANHELLRQMSSATKDSGGQLFRVDQVDDLISQIRDTRRRAERVIIEKRRMGDGPLSGWILMLFFAGSLSVEWLLRRRWGLA